MNTTNLISLGYGWRLDANSSVDYLLKKGLNTTQMALVSLQID